MKNQCSVLSIHRLVALSCFISTFSVLSADPGIDFFEAKIRPVLVSQCYQCHSMEAKNANKLKGGLFLDSKQMTRQGGESGAAVVPGDLKKSLLLSAIKYQDFEMPPKNQLADSVIKDFEKWIEMGAPDSRVQSKPMIQQSINLEEGRKQWCFQPVQDQTPPSVKNSSWLRSEIDQFILAAQEAKGLVPVADATKENLLRRLYLDLVGLPPSTEQITAFQNDQSSNAVEVLVDQLLASPQYGERWGRHWLDVVRYAESNGNTRNATFPHAWRYRDYVIDAFNQDIPYNQFIKQQLSGDLLPAKDSDERNQNLVATGFLALGSKPVIRGKKDGFSPDVAADQIEVTSRAFLGLTVACARCHDHKFDPIPTADYYALAGIFASSKTLYGGGGNTMGAFAATGLHQLEDKDPLFTKKYIRWQADVDGLEKTQKELNSELKKLGKSKKSKNKKDEKDQQATDSKKNNDKTSDKQKRVAELQDQIQQINQELKTLRSDAPKAPSTAMGMTESEKPTEVAIYIRGETPKGDTIPRGFLQVMFPTKQPQLPQDQSGRKELAEWIASKENALTARVMVNRIWLHLFGEGLVRTADNFGVNGDLPSHPELLDYLAAQFMADDWSIKRLIKRIVLTRTYQLSTSHHAKNYEIDPDNVYLWRHSKRRLEAEVIRDAMLAASGQLDLEPPKSSDVESVGEQLIQDKLTPETIHKPTNKRSVYLAILRNGLPEILEIFDLADPSLVVGRRNVTTVPAQDLYLMNNPFVVKQAEHLATVLLQSEASAPNARIDLAYLKTLTRMPTVNEQSRALKYIEEFTQSLAEVNTDEKKSDSPDAEHQAWASFCQALYVSAEFRHNQ